MPSRRRRNDVRSPADGVPEAAYPKDPLRRTRSVLLMEVSTENPVPMSCCSALFSRLLSPPEKRTIPVVSANMLLGVEEGCLGRNRRTGRVDWEDRSTHFHSSLIRVASLAAPGTTSIELSTAAKLTRSRFSEPARMVRFRRIAQLYQRFRRFTRAGFW